MLRRACFSAKTACGVFLGMVMDVFFPYVPKHVTEKTMTKAELVQKIYEKSGLSTKAQAEKALDALIQTLTEAMQAGDSVTFTGFGSFKVAERAARKGRNPRTGKEITIPAGKAVKFTAGKNLKDAVK